MLSWNTYLLQTLTLSNRVSRMATKVGVFHDRRDTMIGFERTEGQSYSLYHFHSNNIQP